MIIIVLTSTILQFAAGLLALWLVLETRRNLSWTLLSAGIFAMAFRRVHTLVEMYQNGDVPSLSFELLGLGISILLFAGIYMIAPLIRNMRITNETLAQNEDRYRTVAEFTYDLEYWLAPEGTLNYISPSCERITGYTQQEFLENPDLLDEIIHPDDREDVVKKKSTLAIVQTSSMYDFRIIDKSGQIHWIARNSVPVYSDDGVFRGVRASARVIDHRKQLEADLKSSRASYQSLVQSAPCLVLRMGPDDVITFANNYALERLGYAETEILGMSLVDLLMQGRESLPGLLPELLVESSASGSRIEFELEHYCKGGVRFWGEWVKSVVRSEFGEIKEFVCVGIDVTQRKVLDRLKEDVTRMVRHDLKSPLSGIIGIPRILRKDENITPRQAELLKTIEDTGTIMLELINWSLNLYKLEAGTYTLTLKEFDVLALIKDAVCHVQIGKEKMLPVQLTINGHVPDGSEQMNIRGDRSLIFSMLGNLIKNAAEASKHKPISIDVSADSECAIQIRNAGVVPESIRDTFFEKYVSMGKPGGTGLGTYSARLIAEKHGGTISMKTVDAVGTTVTVRLPITRG